MSKDKSILDHIMTSKKATQASEFNPAEIVNELLNTLSPREREILNARYSLNGQDKQTLEQIGKSIGVTRERVRQIEAGAIRKLRNLPDEDRASLKAAESLVTEVVESHGGASRLWWGAWPNDKRMDFANGLDRRVIPTMSPAPVSSGVVFWA